MLSSSKPKTTKAEMGGCGCGCGAPAADQLLDLVREILVVRPISSNNEEDHLLLFKKDCNDLVRRISILTHFLEEIRDFHYNNKCVKEENEDEEEGGSSGLLSGSGASTSSPSPSPSFNEGNCWWYDLGEAFNASKRLLSLAGSFNSANKSDGTAKKIAFQFQCVTWRLEKALAKIPYDQFDISEEVQEQVLLVRAQLRRATERYGCMESKMITFALAQPVDKQAMALKGNRLSRTWKIDHCSICNEDLENLENNSVSRCSKSQIAEEMDGKSNEGEVDDKEKSASKSLEELKKPDALTIPEDFLCPISLELLRDPVIVSTGQTYERSYIQRWIDNGNETCPKTQQKLEHFTLTPNYVLRSLISQWCTKHNFVQPTVLANGRIKRSDGSFRDVSGDIVAIQALVRKLSSRSIEERNAAVGEIRSLSKRSTDNRILIAEAGAIPVLVNLLTYEDLSLQENAVTCILNLSIFENNKGLIMLAGAIPSIVQLLRVGTMEARENAAATLFSLSLADENKIIIGASGAIPALVELLDNGSARGRRDAATALFNLCTYRRNKGRAVRGGIIMALLKMLTDLRNCMVDEALAILSVLASNQEAKVAIVKASTIPVLIDLLRTGQPRNKENAAAILLSLCKRDAENLACISRLGAVIPLTELAKSGTERTKRKATSLLEHLRKLQQV